MDDVGQDIGRYRIEVGRQAAQDGRVRVQPGLDAGVELQLRLAPQVLQRPREFAGVTFGAQVIGERSYR